VGDIKVRVDGKDVSVPEKSNIIDLFKEDKNIITATISTIGWTAPRSLFGVSFKR